MSKDRPSKIFMVKSTGEKIVLVTEDLMSTTGREIVRRRQISEGKPVQRRLRLKPTS